MNSYLFGRKQYSPICNVEEGDNSSLRLKLNDGVSPMTYKKLKELGYTSDDWQNWSDDEKFEKSQATSINSQAESGKQTSRQESVASAGAESSSRSATKSTEHVKYTQESYKQLKNDIKNAEKRRDEYAAAARDLDRQGIMQGKPLREVKYSMSHGSPIILSGSPYDGYTRTAPEDEFVAQAEGWVDGKYLGLNTFYDVMNEATKSSLSNDLFTGSIRDVFKAQLSIDNSASKGEPYDPDAVKVMKAFFDSPEYKNYVSGIKELAPEVNKWYDLDAKKQEASRNVEDLKAKTTQAKIDLGLISQQEQDMIKEFPKIATPNAGQSYMDEFDDIEYVMNELERGDGILLENPEQKKQFAAAQRALNAIGGKLQSWNADDGEKFDKLDIKKKYALYKALKEITPMVDNLSELLA